MRARHRPDLLHVFLDFFFRVFFQIFFSKQFFRTFFSKCFPNFFSAKIIHVFVRAYDWYVRYLPAYVSGTSVSHARTYNTCGSATRPARHSHTPRGPPSRRAVCFAVWLSWLSVPPWASGIPSSRAAGSAGCTKRDSATGRFFFVWECSP